ncbi:MAG: anhydro-N-acetylmuramic acid kinase, partial [Planctomycetia bacterium]
MARPKTFRFDSLHRRPTEERWVVGIVVSSECRRLEMVLLSCDGTGLEIRSTIHAAKMVRVPDEIGSLFRQLGATGTNLSESFGRLRCELAEFQAEAVLEFCREAAIPVNQILVLSSLDPGYWCGVGSSSQCLEISDPARLAERTGMNVVDAFSSRDLAQGGQGGPVTAIAEWVLMHAYHETRLLLDLGATTRMTLLPAQTVRNAVSCVLSFEVGPGMRLLDQLTQQLTVGEHTFDPGGSLAVQGQKVKSLLEHWKADPIFDRPLPRWQPHGVRVERFLNDSVRMAIEADWSVRDLLCTATHLVAESIVDTLQRRLPEDLPVKQVLLTGGGRSNGMLLRELAARLPGVALDPIESFGMPDFGPEAAAVA